MENENIKIENENRYKNINTKKMEKIAKLLFLFEIIGIFALNIGMNIGDDISSIIGVILLIDMIILLVLCIIIPLFLCLGRIKIVVTDKRVYGQTFFGKQVDLPLDSISAIGKSIFNSIAVSTSSGVISFICISNRDEIYNVISELLINRQKINNDNSISSNNSSSYTNISNADELKKYKELLDMGAITEEEYNDKKKKLLS